MSLSKTDINARTAHNFIATSSLNEQTVKAKDQTFKRILEKLHIAYEHLTPVIDEIISSASTVTITKLQELEYNDSPICSVTQEQYTNAIKASVLIQEVNNEVLYNSHDQKDFINREMIDFPVADLIKTVQISVRKETDYSGITTQRVYIKRRLVEQFIKLYKLIHKVLEQLYEIAKEKNIKKVVIKSNQDITSNQSNTSKDSNLSALDRLAKLEKEYQGLNDTVKILKSFIEDTSTDPRDNGRLLERNQKAVKKMKLPDVELESDKTKKITDVSGARRCILDCLFELAEARKQIKSIGSTKQLDINIPNKVELTEHSQQRCCKRQDVPHLHAKLNGIAVVLKLNKETVDTILSSVELCPRNRTNEDNWSIESNNTTQNYVHSKNSNKTNQSTKMISSDTIHSSIYKESGDIKTRPQTIPVKGFYTEVNEETIMHNKELVNQLSSKKNVQECSTLNKKLIPEYHATVGLEKPHIAKNKHCISGRPLKHQNYLKIKRSASSPEQNISFHSVDDLLTVKVENTISINKPSVVEMTQEDGMNINDCSSSDKNDECEVTYKQIETQDLDCTWTTLTSLEGIEIKPLTSKTIEADVNKKTKLVTIVRPTASSIRIIESNFELNITPCSSRKKEANTKSGMEKVNNQLINPYPVGLKTTVVRKDTACDLSQFSKTNSHLQNNIYCPNTFLEVGSAVHNKLKANKKLHTNPSNSINSISWPKVVVNSHAFKDRLTKTHNYKEVNYNCDIQKCYSKLDYYANLTEKNTERKLKPTREIQYFDLRDALSENNSSRKRPKSANKNSFKNIPNENALSSKSLFTPASNMQRIYNVFMVKSKYYNYPDEDMEPPRRSLVEERSPGSSSPTPLRPPSAPSGHGQSQLALQPWAPFVTSDISLPGLRSKDQPRETENTEGSRSMGFEEDEDMQQQKRPKDANELPSGGRQKKQTTPKIFGGQELQEGLNPPLAFLQPNEGQLQGGYQYAILVTPSQLNALRTIGTETDQKYTKEPQQDPKKFANKETRCDDNCLYSQRNVAPRCFGIQTAAVERQNQCSQAQFPCVTCCRKKHDASTQAPIFCSDRVNYNSQQASIKVKCTSSGSTRNLCGAESLTDCYKSSGLNTTYKVLQAKEDAQKKLICNHSPANSQQNTSQFHRRVCNDHSCKDKHQIDRHSPCTPPSLTMTQKPYCANVVQRPTNQTDVNNVQHKPDQQNRAAINKSCVKFNNHQSHVHYCFIDKDISLPNRSNTPDNFLQQVADRKDTETLSNNSSEQSQLVKNLKITITTNKCVNVDTGTQYDCIRYHSDADVQKLKNDRRSMHQIEYQRSLLSKSDIFQVEEPKYKNASMDLSNNKVTGLGRFPNKYTTVLNREVNKLASSNSNLDDIEQLVEPDDDFPIKQTFNEDKNCQQRHPIENSDVRSIKTEKSNINRNITFVTNNNKPFKDKRNCQATCMLNEQQLNAYKYSVKEYSKSKSNVTRETLKDKKQPQQFYNATNTRYVTLKKFQSILNLADLQSFDTDSDKLPQNQCHDQDEIFTTQAHSNSKQSFHKKQTGFDKDDSENSSFGNQTKKEIKHRQYFQQSDQITTEGVYGGNDSYIVDQTINENHTPNKTSNLINLPKQQTSKYCESHKVHSNKKKYILLPAHKMETNNNPTIQQPEMKPYLLLKYCNAVDRKSNNLGEQYSINEPVTSKQSNNGKQYKSEHCSSSEQLLPKTSEGKHAMLLHNLNGVKSVKQFQQEVRKEIEVTCNVSSSKYSIKVSQLTDAATCTPSASQEISKSKTIENIDSHKNNPTRLCKHDKQLMQPSPCLKHDHTRLYCNKSTQLPPVVYRSKSVLLPRNSFQSFELPESFVAVQAMPNTPKPSAENERVMTQCCNKHQQTEESSQKCQKGLTKIALSPSIECEGWQVYKTVSQPSLRCTSNTNSAATLAAQNKTYVKKNRNQLVSGNPLTSIQSLENFTNANTFWIPSDYDNCEFNLSSITKCPSHKSNSIIKQVDCNTCKSAMFVNQEDDTYCVHNPDEIEFTKTSLINISKGDAESFSIPTPYESNHSLCESRSSVASCSQPTGQLYQCDVIPDFDDCNYAYVPHQENVPTTSSDDESVHSHRQLKPYTIGNQQFIVQQQLVHPPVRHKREQYLTGKRSEKELLYGDREEKIKRSLKTSFVQQNAVQRNRPSSLKYTNSENYRENNTIMDNCKSTVCWALTKVKSNRNGTQDVEILETSPIPPGHFLIPSANSVILLGNQPYVPTNKQTK